MTAAPSTEIAERTPQQELVAQVRSPEFCDQIAAALPGNLLPQRFQRAATTALMANPDLAKLERNSLFVALLQAAQAGLLPDGKEAAIVAYKDRAQFLAMKDGYIKRAGESGWQVSARVVYEADEFTYEEGMEPKLRHVPARPGTDRGRPVAAYALARHRDGRVAPPVVMYEDEIAKRRAKAQTQAIWNEWTDRMREKTVIKALVKELPTSDLSEWALRVVAAEDASPEQARALMYGPSTDTPDEGEGATNGTPADGQDGGAHADQPVQQAEAAGTSPPAASAPDPEEPDTEPASSFQPPADAQAAKDAADAAGRYEIESGKHKGKSVAQVASEKGGDGWIKWAIKATNHAATPYAKSFARVYLPEVYSAAIAELQAQV